MLHITVIAVGRLSEQHWKQAVAEYAKRLGGFCKLDIVEVEEFRLPQKPGAGEIEAGLLREGAAILDKIPPRSYLIPLCIEGKQLTSQGLARQLEQVAQSHSSIAFVIGGSHGLHPTVKDRAALRLSMSGMTFPHQLARVMVLEQIYRALSISRGLPYHK